MKNITTLLLLFALTVTGQVALAQNVAINSTGTVPAASAMLDISSSNSGLLIPRVALTATNAAGPVTSPATSLLVYNTATAGSSPNNVVPGYYYWNGTNWVAFSTASNTAWTLTGNSGLNAATNFIGTTDDKPLIFKSFGNSFLEFGNRGTLGLTQGYTDYDNATEKITYIRSALQFDAPAASFYKPKMFTDANGNFRVKGSSAGTDYFEFGSTGASNSGGFEFIIGDDGDEPIVFKSYHYINGMSEIMRLQSGRMAVGSNSFNATNPEKLLIDAGTTSSYNLMTGKGSIDNYLQINVQNSSSGGSASSDIVATSNNGSESVNYIDMGINSGSYTNSSSPVLGGANTAYLYAAGNDFVIGNATSGKPLRFFTGGTANSNERMRIDDTGKVGIGNTAPTQALDITGNLKVSGAFMPGNDAGTAGYVLASNGANAAPTWTSPSAGSSWALDGNNISAIKSFGTTSNRDLPFITNNVERMRISNNGSVGIGASAFNGSNAEKLLVDAGTTTSVNAIVGKGSINSYLQLNIQNQSAGTAASSDVVATANNGSESTNYIDMGMNGGSNTSTGVLGGANTGYLYSLGNDFAIGNASTGKDLLFFTDGTASTSERMRIDDSGNVGIGTSSFNATNPEQLVVDAGTTSSVNAIVGKGSINSYLQLNIQNQSSGTSASSDVVATADNGSETTNYIDMGVNGSAYSGGVMGVANDGYLYNMGQNLLIATGTASKSLVFMTGGTSQASNERMRVTGTGTVGIATNAPDASTKLDVNGPVALGLNGSVVNNIVTTEITLGSNLTVTAATTTSQTVTIPTVSGTRGTVHVSLSADLPNSVAIAAARLTSTTQVKIQFLNASGANQTIASGTKIYVSVIDF